MDSLTIRDFQKVDAVQRWKKLLALRFLAILANLPPDPRDDDPRMIAAEKALLAEMIKTPEKALVVEGDKVIVVIMRPDGNRLGVYDL